MNASRLTPFGLCCVPMSEKHTTDLAFSALPLHRLLQEGLADAGFEYCTPIQAESLPLALKGQDVAGQAQTGTGKTIAFLLATMNRLLQHPAASNRRVNQPRALILAPTRELAIQIHKDALQIGARTELGMSLVYGGVDYEKQRTSLEEGVDILIGTPGRIIDYFKQRVFDFHALEVVVMDEADRMFDLGFIKDIRYLFRRMPHPTKRLNMLFSATLSLRVNELAYEHMNNPQMVEIVTEKVTADRVKQVLFHVENSEKIPLLLGLLKKLEPGRTLIFINTKRVAEKVTAYLIGNDYKAATLSGDVPQKKRQALIAKIASGEVEVLVATDVAARGLHIDDVSHVFNFDLPQNEEDYVHRIGRTARAGASGDAISFACETYVYSLMEIEKYIGHRIPVENITDDLIVEPKPPAKIERHSQPQRRTGGKPKSGGRSRQRRPAAKTG